MVKMLLEEVITEFHEFSIPETKERARSAHNVDVAVVLFGLR
ncbi:hypothetical protein [Thermococcus thioreducens]|nr:hypothetical protein [Thermococcus thioreducens]